MNSLTPKNRQVAEEYECLVEGSEHLKRDISSLETALENRIFSESIKREIRKELPVLVKNLREKEKRMSEIKREQPNVIFLVIALTEEKYVSSCLIPESEADKLRKSSVSAGEFFAGEGEHSLIPVTEKKGQQRLHLAGEALIVREGAGYSCSRVTTLELARKIFLPDNLKKISFKISSKHRVVEAPLGILRTNIQIQLNVWLKMESTKKMRRVEEIEAEVFCFNLKRRPLLIPLQSLSKGMVGFSLVNSVVKNSEGERRRATLAVESDGRFFKIFQTVDFAEKNFPEIVKFSFPNPIGVMDKEVFWISLLKENSKYENGLFMSILSEKRGAWELRPENFRSFFFGKEDVTAVVGRITPWFAKFGKKRQTPGEVGLILQRTPDDEIRVLEALPGTSKGVFLEIIGGCYPVLGMPVLLKAFFRYIWKNSEENIPEFLN